MFKIENDAEFMVTQLAVGLLMADSRRMDAYKQFDKRLYDAIMNLGSKIQQHSDNMECPTINDWSELDSLT